MRRPRRLIAATLFALGPLACGDATRPVGQPGLTAVNGAAHPILTPGELAGWRGFGFGSQQAEGNVLVTTAAGLAPADVVEWSDVAILARVPPETTTGPTWVITASDTLGPIPLLVRPATAFDPAARQWAESAALPEARAAAAAAALHYPGDAGLTARVALFGGRRPDGLLSDSTYFASTDENGRINGWAAAPDTIAPPARSEHVMAGADRSNAPLEVESVAYVIGGRDAAGAVMAAVHGLGVTAGGEYGLWTALTPLPGPRAGAAAVVAFGNLYVIGGLGSDSLAMRATTFATINADGTLTGWFAGPSLPEGRVFAAATVVGSTLYLLGGEQGLVDPAAVSDTARLTATIYAIRLSPHTGSFADTAWTQAAASLVHARSRHAAFTLDDALVVVGGVYAGMPAAGESEYAAVAGDGSIAAFAELPAPTIATLAGTPAWSVAAPSLRSASGGGRAAVLGGATPAGPTARTWTQ